MLARMEKTVNVKIDELPSSSTIRDGWRQSSLFFAYAPITIAILCKNLPALYPKSDINWIIEKKGCSAKEAHDYMGRVELMSVSVAIENLLLAAHSLGYGACWLRVPFMAKDELEKMLGAEPPWDLIALVPIGRAAQSPPAPPRKEVDEISTFLKPR
jgi:nitroreductase